MRKLIYKILVLVLFISFSVEMASPIFRISDSNCFALGTEDADDKKDNDKKEKEEEVKDKISSVIEVIAFPNLFSEFFHENNLIQRLGYLSLPELPPDQA